MKKITSFCLGLLRGRSASSNWRGWSWVCLLTGCGVIHQDVNRGTTDIPHLGAPTGPGARFRLSQSWTKEQAGFQPTVVDVSWNEQELTIRASLEDETVTSSSTRDNQKMWELGDVFEMFLQLEGRRGYIELHVTPNNHRLHLKLPGPSGLDATGRTRAFHEMLVEPVGFESRVERIPGGWRVEARVPPEAFGMRRFDAGTRMAMSFCRYDAGGGRETVASSSSPHPVFSFHRPAEWAMCVLRAP